jgi:hypothetical protein
MYLSAAVANGVRMCINYGRPILCEGDESVKLGRLFLEHPLATVEDSRCVVICEIFSMREPLHRVLSHRVYGQSVDRLIAEAMVKLEAWETYWQAYYGRRVRVT